MKDKRKQIDNMIKKLERDLNTKKLIIELTQRNLNRFQSEYEHIEENIYFLNNLEGTVMEDVIVALDKDIEEVMKLLKTKETKKWKLKRQDR